MIIKLDKRKIKEQLDKVTEIYTEQVAVYFIIGVLEAHGYNVEIVEEVVK